MALIHGVHFNNLRDDIYGGLTAAAVALPLALAFGVASGAGPVAGLYGAIFVGLFAALPDLVAGIGRDATILGLLSLAIVYLLPRRIDRVPPAPLVALIGGSVIALTLLPGAPVLGEIPTGLPVPRLPAFELAAIPDMVQAALVLALLGSIDSLLFVKRMSDLQLANIKTITDRSDEALLSGEEKAALTVPERALSCLEGRFIVCFSVAGLISPLSAFAEDLP